MRALTAIEIDDAPESVAPVAGEVSRETPFGADTRRLPLVLDLDRHCATFADRRRLANRGAPADAYARARGLIAALAPRRAGVPAGLGEAAAEGLSETLVAVRRAHAEGREVVLVTAAFPDLARHLCRVHPWASDVIAVPDTGEIAELRLLAAVRARCPAGFVVLPGSRSDPLWARNGLPWSPPAPEPEAVAALGRLAVLARSLRLHQWVKNGLVFLPMILAGRALDPGAWGQAAVAFLAFGLIASATYLVNDLHDLPHDRRHRTKRHRPLASGALPVPAAVGMAAAGLAGGLALTAVAGPAPLLVALTYVALTLAYTFAIKRYPIVDAVTLGGLFTLRLVAGITVCAVAYSAWLLVLSMLLFTSLALVKRLTEIQHLAPDAGGAIPGRGYRAEDAPVVLAFGAAGGTAAVLIFSLYIVEAAGQQPLYAHPAFLWAAPVALFVWLGRVWLLCGRRALRDDPIEFALRDRPSLVLGLVVALSVALAFLDLR